MRAASRLLGVAGAVFLLSGRWTVAGLIAPEFVAPPFYYELRFWAVVALACGVVVAPMRTVERPRGRWFLALLLLFFGWASLSSVWAPDATLALEKVYDLVLAAVATVSVARILRAGAADAFAEGLWGGLLVFGGTLAAIALMTISASRGGERLAVLGGGPNVFGRMMAYLALAALFFWRRHGRTWLYLPIGVVAVFLTLLSGSRGSLIGMAVGVVVFLVREIRIPGRLLLAATTGAALLWVLLSATDIGRIAVEQFYTRVQVQLVEQKYTSGRVDVYGRALDLGHEFPVTGAGLAAFPALGLGPYPHNLFLEAFSETGLVGLGLLVGACVAGIASGLTRRPLPDGATAAAFVLIFVASQFSGAFYDSRGVFVLLIAALRIPAVPEEVRDRRRRVVARRNPTPSSRACLDAPRSATRARTYHDGRGRPVHRAVEDGPRTPA